MTFLDLFDRPNVVECYRRSESVVPQQALAMANSPLSLAQARLLAKIALGRSRRPIRRPRCSRNSSARPSSRCSRGPPQPTNGPNARSSSNPRRNGSPIRNH